MEKKEEKILGVRAFDNYFENKLVISRKHSDAHYVIGFSKFFLFDNGDETGLFVYEYSRREQGFLSTPVKVVPRETFILLPYVNFLSESTDYFKFLDDISFSLDCLNHFVRTKSLISDAELAVYREEFLLDVSTNF